MAKCLLCNTELTNIKISVKEFHEVVRDESALNLVELFTLTLPKDITGKATCKNCGADCDLVGTSENELITIHSETH
jgi:hypothetical protein